VKGDGREREFIALDLERDRVVFFPLSWTIVHPINESSPLAGWEERDFAEGDVEFLVLLNAFDETFSQMVHTRSSYKAAEVIWGARFQSMFLPRDDGDLIGIDVGKLDEIERISL
jgi:inward rectifier potassium channel